MIESHNAIRRWGPVILLVDKAIPGLGGQLFSSESGQ